MPLLLGSEEHTSELQSPCNLVCRLLLETKSSTSVSWGSPRTSSSSCPSGRGSSVGGRRGRTAGRSLPAHPVRAVGAGRFFFFFRGGRPPTFSLPPPPAAPPL